MIGLLEDIAADPVNAPLCDLRAILNAVRTGRLDSQKLDDCKAVLPAVVKQHRRKRGRERALDILMAIALQRGQLSSEVFTELLDEHGLRAPVGIDSSELLEQLPEIDLDSLLEDIQRETEPFLSEFEEDRPDG